MLSIQSLKISFVFLVLLEIELSILDSHWTIFVFIDWLGCKRDRDFFYFILIGKENHILKRESHNRAPQRVH